MTPPPKTITVLGRRLRFVRMRGLFGEYENKRYSLFAERSIHYMKSQDFRVGGVWFENETHAREYYEDNAPAVRALARLL